MVKKIDLVEYERLNDAGLEIQVFWSSEMPNEFLDQLISKSREAHVLKFEAHEDAEGRFKDRQAFWDWQQGKKRLFYLLIDKNATSENNLAGVIWFGEKTNPEIDQSYSLTFGIRLYEGYVGRGLSKQFLTVVHKDMREYFPEGKIWLDYAAENEVAGKAYQSFGYTELARHKDRVVMGRDE